MKLHWSPRSPYVRKVMVAAHELGLVERLTLVRTVVRMSEPNAALLADNPLSKIPTLVLNDGTRLYDSVVIVEYLDGIAGGGRLFPQTAPERFRALVWHALADGLLDILILWRNERDKPPTRQTPEWLSSFAVKVAATLDRFEAEVPAVAGADFSIGHIALGCALSYLDFRFSDLSWRDRRPSLAAWHAIFSARPSARATEVVDDL